MRVSTSLTRFYPTRVDSEDIVIFRSPTIVVSMLASLTLLLTIRVSATHVSSAHIEANVIWIQ